MPFSGSSQSKDGFTQLLTHVRDRVTLLVRHSNKWVIEATVPDQSAELNLLSIAWWMIAGVWVAVMDSESVE